MVYYQPKTLNNAMVSIIFFQRVRGYPPHTGLISALLQVCGDALTIVS